MMKNNKSHQLLLKEAEERIKEFKKELNLDGTSYEKYYDKKTNQLDNKSDMDRYQSH